MAEESEIYSKSPKDRSKEFMRPFDPSQVKSLHDSHSVELRRSKRIEEATKKRNIEIREKSWIEVNSHYKQDYTLEDLPQFLDVVNSQDEGQYLYVAQGLRKIMSHEGQQIQSIVDTGVLSVVLSWLDRYDFPQLQYEASWIFTNIASGEPKWTAALVEKGIIEKMIALMNSPIDELREQAIWCIGNICADSETTRNIVLQYSGLSLLVDSILTSQKESLIKNATWALSNICRTKPLPEYSILCPAIPALFKVFQTFSDIETLSNCLWAFAILSEESVDAGQKLIDLGATSRIFEFINDKESELQLPAIRIVGNISAGPDPQTEFILNSQAPILLAKELKSNRKSIRKEAVWSLSNLCVGTEAQLEILFKLGIFKGIIQILNRDSLGVQEEALWAISNTISKASASQINELVNLGVIPALCNMLSCNSSKPIYISLLAIENILKCGSTHEKNGSKVNCYAMQVDGCGGLTVLENLQSHKLEKIYTKSKSIIETYFEIEQNDVTKFLNMIEDAPFNFD
ncbi:unnamed protein product [Blepharisma stoltei]|uniref:Importin subunit alpha n=1 Tax=Blepharisma stoltei TaxID=1481888 RepID=A0AAU9JJQ5_9CILI|nr:unnamed protein product [Blepharisma stoltei]